MRTIDEKCISNTKDGGFKYVAKAVKTVIKQGLAIQYK